MCAYVASYMNYTQVINLLAMPGYIGTYVGFCCINAGTHAQRYSNKLKPETLTSPRGTSSGITSMILWYAIT